MQSDWINVACGYFLQKVFCICLLKVKNMQLTGEKSISLYYKFQFWQTCWSSLYYTIWCLKCFWEKPFELIVQFCAVLCVYYLAHCGFEWPAGNAGNVPPPLRRAAPPQRAPQGALSGCRAKSRKNARITALRLCDSNNHSSVSLYSWPTFLDMKHLDSVTLC